MKMRNLVPAVFLSLFGCSSTESLASFDTIDTMDDERARPAVSLRRVRVGGKGIFVTSQAYQGGLMSGGGCNLVGADQLCTNAAFDAGLDGVWKAWISTASVNAIDRIMDVGPWFDLRGIEVFANKAALTGTPKIGISINEFGGSVGSRDIWTGTLLTGRLSSDTGTCKSWNKFRTHGMIGETGRTDSAWTAATGLTCDQTASLICLEQ